MSGGRVRPGAGTFRFREVVSNLVVFLESPLHTLVAVLMVVLLGVGLTLAATRATASVEEGPVFVRWMVVVFVTFLALISLPVVVAF